MIFFISEIPIRKVIMQNQVIPKTLLERFDSCYADLTPKSRILCDYIRNNPVKTIFMTTKELAKACKVSEATVVRFVYQLNYGGYNEFIQELRDALDSELSLLDRIDLTNNSDRETDRMARVINEEIDNLKQLYNAIDMDKVNAFVNCLKDAKIIYVIGSRLSFTYAYYLGWLLTKIRGSVHIMKGSDTTTLDRLAIAEAGSLVIIVAMSRYPNELIRIGKAVRRQNHTLVTITDSALCPLSHFSHISLVTPSRHIPYVGSPTAIPCLITCIINELAHQCGVNIKAHQEKLEQTYWENDILFNMKCDSESGEPY